MDHRKLTNHIASNSSNKNTRDPTRKITALSSWLPVPQVGSTVTIYSRHLKAKLEEFWCFTRAPEKTSEDDLKSYEDATYMLYYLKRDDPQIFQKELG